MPSERFIPLRVEVLCGFFVSHRGACEYEIRFSWYLISKAAVFLWKSKGGSCVALFRSLQMFLNRINLKFFNHATVVETRHRRTKRMLSNGFFLLEHHAFQCGTTEKSRVSFLNFFFLVYHNLFFFFFLWSTVNLQSWQQVALFRRIPSAWACALIIITLRKWCRQTPSPEKNKHCPLFVPFKKYFFGTQLQISFGSCPVLMIYLKFLWSVFTKKGAKYARTYHLVFLFFFHFSIHCSETFHLVQKKALSQPKVMFSHTQNAVFAFRVLFFFSKNPWHYQDWSQSNSTITRWWSSPNDKTCVESHQAWNTVFPGLQIWHKFKWQASYAVSAGELRSKLVRAFSEGKSHCTDWQIFGHKFLFKFMFL